MYTFCKLPDISTQDNMILQAASALNPNNLKQLLDEGCNPNARSINGVTPLMHAIMVNDKASFMLLLERGANPNATTEDNLFLVRWRVRSHIERHQLGSLTEKIFNHENENIIGHSTAMVAIKYNRLEMLKCLLEAKVPLKGRIAEASFDLFECAVSNNNIPALKLILPYISSQDKANSFNNGLFVAVEKEHIAAAAFLLSQGANVNYKNSFGYTPLYYAVDRQHNPDMVSLLIQHHADLSLRYPNFFSRKALPQTIQEIAHVHASNDEMPANKKIDAMLKHPTLHVCTSSVKKLFANNPQAGCS